MPISQHQIRKSLRKQRLALTPRQRKLASYQAFRKLSRLPVNFPKNAKIGIYLDAFGEMPVQPIIDWAKRHQFEIYLPIVIGTNKPLKFIKMPNYHPKNWRLIKHALGMRQPANLRQAITVNQLDMLFMPLVGVDNFGYRMGMGGGFYDRTLAKSKQKPIKIGWAYDFQFVEKLAVNPWDIRLDFAILPSRWQKFSCHDLSGYNRAFAAENPAENAVANHDGIQGELSEQVISQVMNPTRLLDLLQRANAFGVVNSEELDSF